VAIASGVAGKHSKGAPTLQLAGIPIAHGVAGGVADIPLIPGGTDAIAAGGALQGIPIEVGIPVACVIHSASSSGVIRTPLAREGVGGPSACQGDSEPPVSRENPSDSWEAWQAS
jgi:hypothetical protein